MKYGDRVRIEALLDGAPVPYPAPSTGVVPP
jgi:hypothetical protein